MQKQGWIALIFLLFLSFSQKMCSHSFLFPLSSELSQQIGEQIWMNECGKKIEGLASWNEREEFASLGIGHFIWYPAGQKKVFKETFPDLLDFMRISQVVLPKWLETNKNCPWESRKTFQAAQKEEKLTELKKLLATHIDVQVNFMVQRLYKALPMLLKSVSTTEHAHVNFQFYRLASTPAGIYTLLDYLNFKGEGIAPNENYQEIRWGLLQVLQQLEGTTAGPIAIEEFVERAKEILTERVRHAPLHRQEERWLKGWFNRLDTYQKFKNN